MARVRSPNRDKAFEIYKEHNGEITNREIANILDTPEKTISGWKVKDKWKDKLNGVLQKKIRSTPNKNSSKKSNVKTKKKVIADEVKEVLENTELNEKHRLFAVIYSKRFNATKAYQQVYHCTYESAMVNGCLLLRNTKVKALIDELTSIEFNKEALKRGILQKYIDIALSDIGDYLKFGVKQVPQWTKNNDGIDVPIIDLDTGEQKIKEYSYVKLKESSMVDTSLITEVSEGKDGIRIKLVDKMKAMEFLSKHLNLLSDEEKIKLDLEYKKLQNVKIQAEISKLNGDNVDIEDMEDIEGEIYGDN